MSIGLEPYVLILLGISAVGMALVFHVIYKQIKLFRIPIQTKNIRYFRRVLFIISLTIVIMGLVPVAINLYTLALPTGRPATVSATSFVYSMGVHLQGFLLSFWVWILYRLAKDEKEMTDYTEKRLEKEAKTEKVATDKTEARLRKEVKTEKAKNKN